MPKININKLDLFLLLGSAMRYCMGRQSYIVGSCGEWLQQLAPHLAREDISKLADEINMNIKVAERKGEFLGMEMDHKEWVKTRDMLYKLIGEKE
jgi:hypothetical protein